MYHCCRNARWRIWVYAFSYENCGGSRVMSVPRTSARFLLVLMSGAVLSACSPSASTAVPPVDAAAPSPALLPVAAQAVATPPVAAAPMEPLVTGLPDFTRLVERNGPAV